MGQRSRRGTFPGPLGEEPELEVEILGFSPQLLGLRQWGLTQYGTRSQANEIWFYLGSGDALLGPVHTVSSQGCYRGPLT